MCGITCKKHYDLQITSSLCYYFGVEAALKKTFPFAALSGMRNNFLLIFFSVLKITQNANLKVKCRISLNCRLLCLCGAAWPTSLARPTADIGNVFSSSMATGRHTQSYCNVQSQCQLDSLSFMQCSSPYTNQIAIWQLSVNYNQCLCHFQAACRAIHIKLFSQVREESPPVGTNACSINSSRSRWGPNLEKPGLGRPLLHTPLVYISSWWLVGVKMATTVVKPKKVQKASHYSIPTLILLQ